MHTDLATRIMESISSLVTLETKLATAGPEEVERVEKLFAARRHVRRRLEEALEAVPGLVKTEEVQ